MAKKQIEYLYVGKATKKKYTENWRIHKKTQF